MCRFRSGILLKTGCVVSEGYSDSHDELLKKLNIADTGENAMTKFVRVELIPPKNEWWGCPEAYDRTANCDLCEWLGGYIKWRPSLHMPKAAARIWLKVTDVRVERLWDMAQTDFMNEGVNTCKKCLSKDMCLGLSNARVCYLKSDFIKLWDSTIKKSELDLYGWKTNPWVWVIEFERCEKPQEVQS